MCGITGIWNLKGGAIDPSCVQAAAHTMRHRGPDDEGYWFIDTASRKWSQRGGDDTPDTIGHAHWNTPYDFTPDLALSQRRLAIIDLSPGGHEPMCNVEGDLWLTFNGEIYNYLELRDELKALGYRFQTECDAEVILQAYKAWGVDCLQRFIGMFAFALYDLNRHRMWVVRDRFGVKPMYFAYDGHNFGFASEIKALRPLVPTALVPDMQQVFWFLHYGSVYNAPYTFFQGVRELPGGHYLLIENGEVGSPVRYWDVDLERARDTYDYADPEAEFVRLLTDAVRLRLRSDVPVGTCLSGGLDSSAIVALATGQLRAEHPDGHMNSFSTVYPIRGMDEGRYIHLVSDHYGTNGHTITPDATDYLKRLERITWHQDIPTGTTGVYSQNFVMSLAQGVVTVLLDGQGADELFGGYLSYVVTQLNDLRRRDPVKWLPQQLRFAAEVWGRYLGWFNVREMGSRAGSYLLHGRQPNSVLKPDLQAQAVEREAQTTPRNLPGADGLNRVLYRALTRDSIPALLHYEDRNSMAYGIEARVPFLDHRMAEFALGVPGDQKVNGPVNKVLMRRALKGILPDEIVNRRDKLGYPTPFGQWLRSDAGLREQVKGYLFDTALNSGWYDRTRVETVWQQHVSGARNHDRTIHTMITAAMWYQQHASA